MTNKKFSLAKVAKHVLYGTAALTLSHAALSQSVDEYSVFTDYNLSKEDFGDASYLYATSADGSISAGYMTDTDKSIPMAWVFEDGKYTAKPLVIDEEYKSFTSNNAVGIDASGSTIIANIDVPIKFSKEVLKTFDAKTLEIIKSRASLESFPVAWVNGQYIKLPTLNPTKAGKSKRNKADVAAISGNGKVIGGRADNLDAKSQPTVWYGDNFATIKQLSHADYSDGSVKAADFSGETLVGWVKISTDDKKSRAIVWTGDEWGTHTILSNTVSTAKSISADGRVIGGNTDQTAEGETFGVAKIWTKDGGNWTETAINQNGKKYGLIEAINQDGTVLAGRINDDRDDIRATVWAGENYSNIIDLGSFKADNSGRSGVRGLSADGTVVVGWADSDENDKLGKPIKKSALWKLSPYYVLSIDVANTLKSVHAVGNKIETLLANKYSNLYDLQEGCFVNHKGFCFATGSDFLKNDAFKEAKANFRAAYGFNEHFLLGANVNSTYYNSSDVHDDNLSNDAGFGVFGQARFNIADHYFYVRPYAAYKGISKLLLTRPQLDHTEFTRSFTKAKGYSFKLEIGQELNTAGRVSFEWYLGAKHSNLSTKAYTETGIEFPLSYKAVELKDTSVVAGAKVAVKLGDKFSWKTSVSAEHSFKLEDPLFSAYGEYLGVIEKTLKYNKTRYALNSGLYYSLNQNVTLSLTPKIERALLGKYQTGFALKLEGTY